MAPLAVGLIVLLTVSSAPAAHRAASEGAPAGGRSASLPQRPAAPGFIRSASGTTWIRVHLPGQSPCSPADTAGSGDGQTIEHVWCFEGAAGDSTWPAIPAPQSTGSRHDSWDHWSAYAPPVPPPSRWHMSNMNPNASTWNAWCGCDSLVGVPGYANNDAACSDVGFWVFKKGYADGWNYALELRADGAPNDAGSVVAFDVRYDTECNYDYLYVEYSTNAGGFWSLLRDGYPDGAPAVFNAVSGNPDVNHGGTGRACGGDYFGCSDQYNPGGGNIPFHGFNRSKWSGPATFPKPSFPIPANASNGVRIRWRAFSDGAWSDADGRGDTDGHSAVDNVVLTINAGGTSAADDFESGTSSPLAGRVPPIETIPGSVTWFAGAILGSAFDGWHLEFDPKYKNKGNSCSFADDWMWAARPAAGPIPPSAAGFDFFLASPVIGCVGWTGGVVEFAEYFCWGVDFNAYTESGSRYYDTALGWSPWQFPYSWIWDPGCNGWNLNTSDDLTEFLGATVESLQVGWRIFDASQPGDQDWGKHGSIQYLVDNVSIGSFDVAATTFTARAIDLFADTFSRSDPAHTSFLAAAEQGNWEGLSASPPGTRAFANADSLTVEVHEPDGVTAANVDLWWRHDDGGSGTFGAFARIDMTFSTPNPHSATDEGTYRAIVGKDDGGAEDVSPPADNREIWKPGTTVHYYVKVVDDAAHESVFPRTAADFSPLYFEFSVLPFGRTTPFGERVLLVDDVGERLALDFENSNGFDPDGGTGNGGFEDPQFSSAEDLMEGALALLVGGSEANPKWDLYDVQGAGSSVQCEPNGPADPTRGLGGFLTELGAPAYDVLIWPQLDLDAYSLADTTRLHLETYLDAGGKLLACGNEIAFHLGEGGNDADSLIGFLNDYLGTAFPNAVDDETADRTLHVTGNAGSSLAGVELGLYGDCPLRFAFDRLTQTTAPASGSLPSVLAVYAGGDASDNGRPSVIKNVRSGADLQFGTADDGVAVLCGFDVAALLSEASRACFVGRILSTDMGITVSSTSCPPGLAAPATGARFGFALAAASPNPFTKSTTIRFSIPSRERVELEIVNVLGQRVRTLVNEPLDANAYVREWDGLSEAGRRASNGIYFVRIVAGEFTETRKLVLLR